MEEQRELNNCATCHYHIRNTCTSYDGYYMYREVIINEVVPCEEWTLNDDSFTFKPEKKSF